MQKSALLVLTLIAFVAANAQEDPIVQANKCYDEKNYQCAIKFYSEAISTSKYQQKDFATIQYRIGYGYSALEKYSEAVPYFQKAIENKQDYRAAYWDLAYAHFKLANYDKAAEFYGKAAVYYAGTDDVKAVLYWKARSEKAQKKYAEALTTLKDLIQKYPAYTTAYALAGDASYDSYKYRDAVDYYSKSISLASSDEKAVITARHFWRGKSYYGLYRFDSAYRDYQKVLELDPSHKSVVWEIAAVYYNQSKWPEAAAQYTKASQLYADDTASLKKIYYFAGYSYEKTKDYAKAVANFDAALKIDPFYLSAIDRKAGVFLEQKKYKEAIAIYAKAIEVDKSHYYSPGYYAKKAKAYLILKDTTKALEEIRMAQLYDEDGEVGEVNIVLGNINFGKKKYTDAATNYDNGLGAWDYYDDNATMSTIYLRKGISNLFTGNYYSASEDLEESTYYDSLNKEAHRYLAEAYYAQASYASAIKEFTTSIRMYGNVKDSLYKLYSYRGQTYFLQKDFQKALADYEQADKIKPNTVDIITGIGQLAFELRNYEKVISSFTKAIALYKPAQKEQLAFAYYARGRAYHEMKDKAKATADITRALELVPTYAEAKNWLAVVKSASY